MAQLRALAGLSPFETHIDTKCFFLLKLRMATLNMKFGVESDDNVFVM